MRFGAMAAERMKPIVLFAAELQVWLTNNAQRHNITSTT